MSKAIALPFARSTIEAGEFHSDALISIGPSQVSRDHMAVPVIPNGHFRNLLHLSFDDIPCSTFTDGKGTIWCGPTSHDLETALDFARKCRRQDPACLVAVQCEQGRSRSAAIALAITADELGEGQEVEAVRLLLAGDDEQRRCFNPLIVRLADQLLDRQGAIEAALEAKCRPFLIWRRYWVKKGVLPLHGLPEKGHS